MEVKWVKETEDGSASEALGAVAERLARWRHQIVSANAFRTSYRTVVVTCRFPSTSTSTEREGGFVRLTFGSSAQQRFVLRVGGSSSPSEKSEEKAQPNPSGMVGCLTQPLADTWAAEEGRLESFAAYLVDGLGVSRVVTYDVGLVLGHLPPSSSLPPFLSIVPVRDELEAAYGSIVAAHDAVVYAPRLGAVAFRYECAWRATAAGAAWALWVESPDHVLTFVGGDQSLIEWLSANVAPSTTKVVFLPRDSSNVEVVVVRLPWLADAPETTMYVSPETQAFVSRVVEPVSAGETRTTTAHWQTLLGEFP